MVKGLLQDIKEHESVKQESAKEGNKGTKLCPEIYLYVKNKKKELECGEDKELIDTSSK